MKTLGNRAHSYCEYCHAKGVWNKGLYCPFSAPKDPPPMALKRGPIASLVRSELPLRRHEESLHTANHIVNDLCDTCRFKNGLRGVPILSNLKGIDFPKSFPPDLMHLFYENILPAMFRHYRGVFKGCNSALALKKVSGKDSPNFSKDLIKANVKLISLYLRLHLLR